MGKHFGTDGFRGEANIDLTVMHAFEIGRYLGWYYGKEHKARVVIGKDTRRSSYMFESALCAGLTASGADAYLLHVTTTPSVSYIARADDFDCGIMISASHNPYYDKEGYRSFIIPDNVGGRFSVLTPVGLLPIACAGIDIEQLVAGAVAMEKQCGIDVPFEENPAAIYAATRNALYQNGKKIEILINYQPKLHFYAEWWKQLYGESEGKDGNGNTSFEGVRIVLRGLDIQAGRCVFLCHSSDVTAGGVGIVLVEEHLRLDDGQLIRDTQRRQPGTPSSDSTGT